MRAAPAVDAALGSGRFERMVIVLLHAGTGAAVAGWASAHVDATAGPLAGGLGWWLALAVALAMGAVGWLLARRALPAEPAQLCWDGTAWQLRTDALRPLGQVVVAMELGAWVLLQLRPAPGRASHWRVAAARDAGASWHGLRVALQAHAGDAPGGAPGRADRPGRRPGDGS
jgi:hypothetical protein